ncbi:hypothetical protein E4Q08_02770 [Candidatus Accumulibacter phosphatis]|uniref:Uncharacterized protein n=1 Tax=Candidatus Accumulibacter contiguus TaxID=2954381 RepID=A0ABX1T6S2_9PROT|nr:hypothetical protein [Candidatus Accumulibacter contiguus]
MLILATGFLVAHRGKNLPPSAHQKTDRFLGGLTCKMTGQSAPHRVRKPECIRTFGTDIS